MQLDNASRPYRIAALVFAASTLSLPIALPAFSQNVAVIEVDVIEVAHGYRASELTGASVDNGTGETIGTIDDLIVDREKVLFAILQIGGFLGIGGHLVAIPYDSLEINEDGTLIVLSEGSKEELEALPEFEYAQE